MAPIWLDRLAARDEFPAVAPGMPFTAIGDVHGCAELLAAGLQKAGKGPVICVGDLVDRGEHSADVLRMLCVRPEIICLSGNHEEMMLRFIEAPEKYGAWWLRNGGLQTLHSFGVAGVDATSGADTWKKARDHLIRAMGDPLVNWMKSLPTRWQSGNIAVVHAGADPALPIEKQTTKTLHWGHPKFLRKRRRDGIWVLHGHTIVDAPYAEEGRIAIDTGAYATGRLTLARVENAEVVFETVG